MKLKVHEVLMLMMCIIAILATSGCGSNSGSDNCHTKVSYTHDQVGPSGLMLRATQEPYITFADMEKIYRQTEACVGVTTTGPTVAYVDLKAAGYSNYSNTWGLTQLYTGLVVINTYMPARSCATDTHTLKHEFVHYLLHAKGFPEVDNEAHNSPLFTQCTV
jgi:hypothetical protein